MAWSTWANEEAKDASIEKFNQALAGAGEMLAGQPVVTEGTMVAGQQYVAVSKDGEDGFFARFEADVFIGEYGCGPSGIVKTDNFTHYAKGHHFLSVRSPEVLENLVRFAPKFREVATVTNGRYHFGKNDLITTYIKCLDEEQA